MITLLQQYSLSDILIFLILFALSVKSLITFFDWAYSRIKIIFSKEFLELNAKEELQQRLHHGSQIMNSLQQRQQQTDKILENLSKKIDMLIDSDKDSIKLSITKQHHYFCYQVGWIDDFSLDCLERRFQHYREEGGNSFIQNFMEQLHALPKGPPQELLKQEKKGEQNGNGHE